MPRGKTAAQSFPPRTSIRFSPLISSAWVVEWYNTLLAFLHPGFEARWVKIFLHIFSLKKIEIQKNTKWIWKLQVDNITERIKNQSRSCKYVYWWIGFSSLEPLAMMIHTSKGSSYGSWNVFFAALGFLAGQWRSAEPVKSTLGRNQRSNENRPTRNTASKCMFKNVWN